MGEPVTGASSGCSSPVPCPRGQHARWRDGVAFEPVAGARRQPGQRVDDDAAQLDRVVPADCQQPHAAAALALAAAAAGWTPPLPALLYLAWAGTALAIIDLEHRRWRSAARGAVVAPSVLVDAVRVEHHLRAQPPGHDAHGGPLCGGQLVGPALRQPDRGGQQRERELARAVVDGQHGPRIALRDDGDRPLTRCRQPDRQRPDWTSSESCRSTDHDFVRLLAVARPKYLGIGVTTAQDDLDDDAARDTCLSDDPAGPLRAPVLGLPLTSGLRRVEQGDQLPGCDGEHEKPVMWTARKLGSVDGRSVSRRRPVVRHDEDPRARAGSVDVAGHEAVLTSARPHGRHDAPRAVGGGESGLGHRSWAWRSPTSDSTLRLTPIDIAVPIGHALTERSEVTLCDVSLVSSVPSGTEVVRVRLSGGASATPLLAGAVAGALPVWSGTDRADGRPTGTASRSTRGLAALAVLPPARRPPHHRTAPRHRLVRHRRGHRRTVGGHARRLCRRRRRRAAFVIPAGLNQDPLRPRSSRREDEVLLGAGAPQPHRGCRAPRHMAPFPDHHRGVRDGCRGRARLMTRPEPA